MHICIATLEGLINKEFLGTMKDLLKMTKPTLCNELFVFYSVVNKNRNINNQCETQRIDLIIFSDSFSQKLFHDVTQRHKACLSIEIPGLKVLNTQLYVNRRIKFLKKSLKTGRKIVSVFFFSYSIWKY